MTPPGPRLFPLFRRGLVLLAALLSGCAAPVPTTACLADPPGQDVIWVVDHGWHIDIGVPADAVTGPLAVYRTIFPGARVLMFGFGKRTFMTAKVDNISELLLGPVPGPGAIEVIGLRMPPGAAYEQPVTTLPVPPGGMASLSNFLWRMLGKTRDGAPRLINAGHFPGSLFYASTHGYSLFYTCNTWAAQAIRAAQVPVNAGGVLLPGGVLRQTARQPGACEATPGTL